MKLSFLFFFNVFFCYCFSQQNLNQNYTPLKSSGELPKVFTQNIRQVIRQDIEQMNDSNNKNLKAQFFTSSNYQIEKLIRSGNTLINDEVSIYLNEIVNNILKNDPALRSKISVYAFKSVVVNAYSYDKGYVFVDLGLIAQAETEAQLAYLLCHEIMHYLKNHQVNAYVNQELIEKASQYEDKFVEKCQYSKELEAEADIEGFKLFEKSAYNPKQALKLFDVLQYSHLPFELVEFKKNFFETKDYIIPATYFKKEVTPIKNNSDQDDSKSTHPNTAKRKSIIAEKIKFAETENKHDFIIGKEKFEYIRDIARMELCRLYLKNRDYPNAIYASYVLKQKFPNNQYLEEIICKSLYAISLYKNKMLSYDENSYLPKGVPSSSTIEGDPQRLYDLINNFPANEFVFLSLNYVYRTHKKIPENKQVKVYSDSLFGMMKKVSWGISDFNRELKGNNIVIDTASSYLSKTDRISKLQKTTSKEDSVYYKNMFTDLLNTDKYFSEKFPLTAPAINSSEENRSEKKKEELIKGNKPEIAKVLFLEPFYYKINKNGSKFEYEYIESDIRQEKFLANFTSYASAQNFELITFDPGVMTVGEIAKMNDYSVLNDWLSEKFDSGGDKNVVFNTNEIESLISKYNTKYVLKMGVIAEESGLRNRIYFCIFVIDIQSNKIVHGKIERFKGKDKEDFIHAKTYEMIYNLKNSKTF